MPAYNFQKQFAPLVESGEKRQTIRAKGKRTHAQPGAALQLYTGMRTKVCRKLVNPDPVCTEVLDVYMYEAGGECFMQVGGKVTFAHEVAEIARADGFATREEFFQFFRTTHGMPFHGVLIKW